MDQLTQFDLSGFFYLGNEVVEKFREPKIRAGPSSPLLAVFNAIFCNS